LNIGCGGALENFLCSFRKRGPAVVLGLGGALTIVWIVLITWIPFQMLVSMISLAVINLLSI
jgi:hypothetical protein